MHNILPRFSFSPVSICTGFVAILAVIYIGLIAVVMSYATLTIEFSQSVKNNEASVAGLEKQYLTAVAHITTMDYASAGYTLPLAKTFVKAKSGTALR